MESIAEGNNEYKHRLTYMRARNPGKRANIVTCLIYADLQLT